MTHWNRLSVVGIFAAVFLTACQSATPIETIPEAPKDTELVTVEVAPKGCPIIASRNWSARIDRMPGVNTVAMLKVSGEIDLPTPGYVVTVTEGRADRSAVPMQTLILELTPPDGIVMQVVTPEDVYFEGPAIAEKYRSITVTCGGEIVTQIDTVDDVS